MDCTDNFTGLKSLKGNDKTQMIPIKSGRPYQVEPFCESKPEKMARHQFQDHPPPKQNIIQGVLF